jgi:hypothetical protein
MDLGYPSSCCRVGCPGCQYPAWSLLVKCCVVCDCSHLVGDCGGGGGGGGDDLEGRGENGGGAHAGGGDGHGGGGGGGWSGGGASHGWFQCSVNLDRLSWNAAAYQEVRALGAAWTCPLVAQACLVEA